jgi:hypothetical protein
MTRAVYLVRESLLITSIAFLGVGSALLATSLAFLGIGVALLAGRRHARLRAVALQPAQPAPEQLF